MHGLIFLATFITYQCAQAAAHNDATLPFKLGSHTFDQHIEQEYQLHIYHRLKKLGKHYPHHPIVSLYKHLTTTPLNHLIAQQELLEKSKSVYTSIQTCPDVINQFNQALTKSQQKEDPEAWQLFRLTAYSHLRKFHTAELPQLDLSANQAPTSGQINAYKTWLIVYFAIKQNEHMGIKTHIPN